MSIYAFSYLVSKEIVKTFNPAGKGRHTLVVCIIHNPYLEINIQAAGSFRHNWRLFVEHSFLHELPEKLSPPVLWR